MPDDRTMAKTTITQVTDDLDGSSNAETVTFALGKDEYTIDLGKKNRSALEKALKPYIAAGTKLSKRSSRAGARGRRSGSSGTNLAEVRSWAAQNGYEISNRGRVPKTVLDAYEAAH